MKAKFYYRLMIFLNYLSWKLGGAADLAQMKWETEANKYWDARPLEYGKMRADLLKTCEESGLAQELRDQFNGKKPSSLTPSEGSIHPIPDVPVSSETQSACR